MRTAPSSAASQSSRRALRRRAGVALSALLALAPALAATPQASDPFAGGRRWSVGPTAPDTWIPRDVAFAGHGEFVWAAPSLQVPGLFLLASGATTDASAPVAFDSTLVGAIGAVRVAAGDELDELFALAQYPAPDGAHRQTLVTGHDAMQASLAGSFAPVWTYDPGPIVNGPGHLAASADGELVCVALYDPAAVEVQIDVLDGSNGALLATRSIAGGSLRAIALSADGARVALSAGTDLWVLDTNDLATLHQEVLSASTRVLTLSADGGVLAWGGGDRVHVATDTGAGYLASFEAPAGAQELPVMASLSEDGSTLAIAWWDSVTAVQVRCNVLDVASHATTNTFTQSGPVGGLQNYPAGLDVSADGTRIALGLWGVGDAQPEVLLFERGVVAPVLTDDLPGSVHALALDRSGTRLAIGAKDTHANLFATSGEIVQYDTGERRLQLVAPALRGGTLELALRTDQPGLVLFALGSPLASGLSLPAVGGTLWLDPTAATWFGLTTADATLRAHLQLPLWPGPGLVGYPLAVQAVVTSPTGPILVAELARPAIL